MTLLHDRTNLSEKKTSVWPLMYLNGNKQYDQCLRGPSLHSILHVPQEDSDSEALYVHLHVVTFTHGCTEL